MRPLNDTLWLAREEERWIYYSSRAERERMQAYNAPRKMNSPFFVFTWNTRFHFHLSCNFTIVCNVQHLSLSLEYTAYTTHHSESVEGGKCFASFFFLHFSTSLSKFNLCTVTLTYIFPLCCLALYFNFTPDEERREESWIEIPFYNHITSRCRWMTCSLRSI